MSHRLFKIYQKPLIFAAAAWKVRILLMQRIRFGKTMAVTMLSAYYSKGCYSEKLFAGLKISRNELFKVHLNKYNVIFLYIQWMYGNALEEMKRNSSVKVVSYI